ncbi:MAG: DUF1829 domain-containing protein [Bacillota bacterium]
MSFRPSVQFIGKSGFSHIFDFVIPSSKLKPEVIENRGGISMETKITPQNKRKSP